MYIQNGILKSINESDIIDGVLNIPENLGITEISDNFLGNSQKNSLLNYKEIKKINFPDGLQKIGEFAFACTNIEEVILPDSVTKLSEGAFAECTNLRKVVLSKNLTELSRQVFAGATSLEEIVIPKNVEKIELAAFTRCENLKNVKFLSSRTLVERNAFWKCLEVQFETPTKIEALKEEIEYHEQEIAKLKFKLNQAQKMQKVENKIKE